MSTYPIIDVDQQPPIVVVVLDRHLVQNDSGFPGRQALFDIISGKASRCSVVGSKGQAAQVAAEGRPHHPFAVLRTQYDQDRFLDFLRQDRFLDSTERIGLQGKSEASAENVSVHS
jgi:hypothetical protein